MAGTFFQYNSITIPYAFHGGSGFRQSVVMDDSQTDRLYTKFDLRVQGVINTAYANIIGVAGNTPAELANNMRAKLIIPRKKLSVKMNDVEMIPSTSDDGIDAKNGPIPGEFLFTIISEDSFIFDYTITAHYAPTGAGMVLSNRWTDAQNIDDCNFSTWTRSGKYIIRSDGNTTVDALRPTMAMLGVPKNFLRVSSSYTVSEDGLRLQYTITDRETFKLPPVPAFKASGTYTEETTKGGGKRYGIIHLTLEGARAAPDADQDVNQAELIKTAVYVALAKLNLGGPEGKQNPINGDPGYQYLESTRVSIDLWERNKVTVDMRALMKPRAPTVAQARLGAVASMKWQAMTETPLSPATNGITPAYELRGSADILLQAAAYWDPLLAQKLNFNTRQIVPGKEIK